MKKAIVLLPLLVFLVFSSWAQPKSKKVDVSWGPTMKHKKRLLLSEIVGYDESGIYTLKNGETIMAYGVQVAAPKVYIDKYGHDLSLAQGVQIEMEAENKKMDFEFSFLLKGKLWGFYSFRNRKQKKNFLFVQAMDKQTLLASGDLKKIAEIDYSQQGMLNKGKYNKGNFDFDISRDSSKVLIYYNLPYRKGESEQLGFHVMDQNLNQLWEKQVTLPYKDELFEDQDYQVDENANVYLLGLLYREKPKEKRKGVPNCYYQILRFDEGVQEPRTYDIKIPGKFLTDMQFAINDQNDIICGGFYSSKNTFNMDGSYYLRVDGKSKEIVLSEFQEFGIEFITQNMSEKMEKRTKKKEVKGKSVELYHYKMDDIILRDDGGALLVAEQYLWQQITRTNRNGVTMQTDRFLYNDIIVVNISPEGTIDWTEKIAKKQTSHNDFGYFSSYVLSVVGDQLYFIFNDNPKNLYYKGSGTFYPYNRGKESLVVLVTLDSEGKQTREALFSSEKGDLLSCPKASRQISDKELILYAAKRRKYAFARLTFKD